jgi:hypothetical protein
MQPSVQQPISKDKNVMGPGKKILFKKQLFDLKVKDQGPTKVITVHDTPPYGHLWTETCPFHVQPLLFMPQMTNSESIKQRII